MGGVGLDQVIQDGIVEGVKWGCAGDGDGDVATADVGADEIEKMGRRRYGPDPTNWGEYESHWGGVLSSLPTIT